MITLGRFAIALCLGTFLSSPSRATVPVIDAATLAEMVQEILYWREQLQGMTQEISTLEQQISVETGRRGLEALVPQSIRERNYLPQTGADLLALMSGAGAAGGALANGYSAAMAQLAVLTPAQLAGLSPFAQQRVVEARQTAAMRTALLQSAIERASARFGSLQGLIDAIGGATDPKAIAELQARIAAEQVMQANDLAKLNALTAWAEAQASGVQLRRQEAVVATHGAFIGRFEPQNR